MQHHHTHHTKTKKPMRRKLKPAVPVIPLFLDFEIDLTATDGATRDPLCAELGRHRPNCECSGEMREPF